MAALAAPPLLRGAQTPRVSSLPVYASSIGRQVIDLAAMAGVYLDPWQQLVIEYLFARDESGRLCADELAVIVARQNGKGEIILVAELGWLFITGEPMILHTAHQTKTSDEGFLRIKEVIAGCPTLARQCLKPRDANGQQEIRTRDGSRLRFVARSKSSGRGFTVDKLVLDEAYDLDETHMSALQPTTNAVPEPQLLYMSSAPHASDLILNAVCDRGQAGTAPRLAYFEWSADPDKPRDDPEQWAQANPAIGYRLSLETIGRSLSALPPAAFDREVLSIREDPGAGGVIEEATWARLTDPVSTCGTSVAFALDMPPGRDHVSICAVGVRPDGMHHLEVIATMPSHQVAGWLTSPDRTVRPLATVVDKGSPAGSLIPDLEAAGVEVTSPTLQQLASACGDFLDEVLRPDALRHLGDPLLAAAAKGVTKRDVGDGGFAWARKSTAVDISPLVAGTLALWGFKTRQGAVTDITQVVW